MVRTSLVVLSLAVIAAACAPGPPPDAATLVSNATAALGAEDLATIEYSGSGWDSGIGQAWSVQETWPQFELRGYNRVIDYEAGTSRQTAERQVLDPTRLGGGGAQPGAAPQNQQTNIAADAGWQQKLPIYFTPYGFLRLAADQEAAVEAADMDGSPYNVLSFPIVDGENTYQMRGYFDEDNLLGRIETWLDNPVMGDMLVEVEFRNYESFDGLLFPTQIAESRGGLGFKELMVDSVTPNATIEAPAEVAGGGGRGGFGGRGGGGRGGGGRGGRGGGAGADAEPSIQLGDGIWVVTGGYQSTVVEFDDYVAVIEGAQNAARSQAIIAEAKRLTGDKPIRYFITTHSHFDHISGIRDFVAEGATIIAHESDVEFYERALNTPHTLNPDLAQETGASATVQGVTNGFVLEDGTQRVELYKIEGSLHADDMMVAYLPGIRTVVEADMVQPWLGGAFSTGPGPHPFVVHVAGELERLVPDYETILPVHAPNPPPTVTREQVEQGAAG